MILPNGGMKFRFGFHDGLRADNCECKGFPPCDACMGNLTAKFVDEFLGHCPWVINCEDDLIHTITGDDGFTTTASCGATGERGIYADDRYDFDAPDFCKACAAIARS